MEALRQLLQDNNILLHKEAEEQEYHYFTVEFTRIKGKLYTADPNHPLLKKLNKKFNIVEGKIVLTHFELQHVIELIKLEQGNYIIL